MEKLFRGILNKLKYAELINEIKIRLSNNKECFAINGEKIKQILFFYILIIIVSILCLLSLVYFVIKEKLIFYFFAMIIPIVTSIWFLRMLKKQRGFIKIINWMIITIQALSVFTILLGVDSIETIDKDINNINGDSVECYELRRKYGEFTSNFTGKEGFSGCVDFYTNMMIVGMDKLARKPNIPYDFEENFKKDDDERVKIEKLNKKLTSLNDFLQVEKQRIFKNLINYIVLSFVTMVLLKAIPKL